MTVDFNIIPIEYLLIDRSSIPFYKTTKNPRLVERNSKLWKKISKDILKRDNYTCAYCGKEGEYWRLTTYYPFQEEEVIINQT